MNSSPSISRHFTAATFYSAEMAHSLPYRVLWPSDYTADATKKYPLILFLHGAGERGDNNLDQLKHGASFFLEHRDDFPAIILLPQCAKDDYWAQMVVDEDGGRTFNFHEKPNPSLAATERLLHHFLTNERVDPDRVYLMGLSMGGMGTYELLARQPTTFAAAVPICGGTNPLLLRLYASRIPLWIFHGAIDRVVDVAHSRRVVGQLAHLGVVPRYTEYAGVGHHCWERVFQEEELMAWLFGQRKELI